VKFWLAEPHELLAQIVNEYVPDDPPSGVPGNVPLDASKSTPLGRRPESENV
jgi:hypothetical protein